MNEEFEIQNEELNEGDENNSEFGTENAEVNMGAGEAEAPGADEHAALASHLASLYAQSAELAREIPGFDLKKALRDPDFLRMTSPAVGLSVRRAWYALHGEEREKLAARRAGEAAADALRRGSSRPREGERSLSGGTLSRSDPASLGRVERAALRQRIYDAAARGEKIYP